MIAPLPTDVKVFEDRASAERWCAGLLTKAGIPVPIPLQQAKADAH
jgi:hypothetical protein